MNKTMNKTQYIPGLCVVSVLYCSYIVSVSVHNVNFKFLSVVVPVIFEGADHTIWLIHEICKERN